ncbi:hypothetical protein [Methanosphaera sp. BMS]|uniref:hypothetical protein n=1 Tax=Methanosphaera sp. BMS TaxID=1789762 RepID=UPI000DC1E309|nr:hypothetical protein [Methanosphaera sp. BMS]AWX31692.1 hypothetical protein AW729_00695 [Methanosphaera sp. BMS]
MNKIWIESLQNKYRFEFKGLISVEDLFDLKLEDLNCIYISLKKKEKELQIDSLMDKEDSPQIKEVETKIEIVKSIFKMKDAEIKRRQQEVINNSRKQKILSIIEDKQDQELSEKSVEELRKIYEEL